MSKKDDFLRSEQNRDKHPESKMTGSAADVAEKERRESNQTTAPADRKTPHTGKYANDRNKMGHQEPTQINEGRRDAHTRHDEQVISGGAHNVVEARTGGTGAGRGPRGEGGVGGGKGE